MNVLEHSAKYAVYHISSNKRRGVYFKLLTARKAFIRGRHLLEGGVYFFSASIMSL